MNKSDKKESKYLPLRNTLAAPSLVALVFIFVRPGIIVPAAGLQQFGLWLKSLGMIGLFLISLLDSALIPLPTGPDLMLIALSAVRPAWMLIYVLCATTGSTIGCTMLYMAARKAGERALRGINPQRRERVENLLGKYDVFALILPAILPPPFPFKPFILSAGVFKLKKIRFVIAILIGRSIRFLIEGVLAIRFGENAWLIIRQNFLKVLIIVSVVIVIVAAIHFIIRRASRESNHIADDNTEPSGD